MKTLRVLVSGLLALAITLNSQAGDKKEDAPPGPLVVPVSKPIQRAVTDYVDYTGRTNAKEFVTIQPRVTGFLVKTSFREGAEVNKGDVLFEIDPRPYEAQYMAAKAKVTQGEASLKHARVMYARFKEIAAKQRDAVSPRELDAYQALEEQAAAGLELAKADLIAARINLDWTVVRSPIDGHVGRSLLTVGNLVKQDETMLTTVVSMDPMNVYFNMDEATLLRIRRALKNAKAPAAKEDGDMPVQMGLADEEGYPHRGTINFVDNQVNPAKGGIVVRGVFANPRPKGGVPLMLPGMFVHVRLPLGQPYEALLVIDRAIWSDQGLKYVYVVGADNKVEVRQVTTGPLQEDGLRAITRGLKQEDSVIIGGLQKLRPRMIIEPERVAMPALVKPARK